MYAICFFICRTPRATVEEVDIDCDMLDVRKQDDDTDVESFERNEREMEEEAARVSIRFLFSLTSY